MKPMHTRHRSKSQGIGFVMALGACLFCVWHGLGSAGAPDDTKPTALSATASFPAYRIYPLRNGQCQIAGHHAFHGGNETETYDYALYLWLILGGDKPMLVDAGLGDVAEMNRGAAHVLRKPITQAPHETSRAQLRKFSLTPADIGCVFITHLHFDHVDDLLLYTNATVYVGRKEWEGAIAAAPTWGHGRILHEFSRFRIVLGGRAHPGFHGLPRPHCPRLGRADGGYRFPTG
jgi:glyoxylase-like metal-dependent hydrolase (beta-lactamase superfamily II)